nr:9872_t:CDS:2 [Entrophospora candida]
MPANKTTNKTRNSSSKRATSIVPGLVSAEDAKSTLILTGGESNEEVQALMMILGLEQGRTYDSLSNLEYGSLLIMTDQDLDGNHITGLIINFLDCLFPSLLRQYFLQKFVTPIVKCNGGQIEMTFIHCKSSNNGKLAMKMEKDGILSTMRDLEIAPLMKPKNISTTWIDMLKIQADKRKTWILYQLLG